MGPSGRSCVLATGGLTWPTPATARSPPGSLGPGVADPQTGLAEWRAPEATGGPRLGLGLSRRGLSVLGLGMWNVGSSCTEATVSIPDRHLLPLPPVPGSSALLSVSPFLW